MPFEHCQHVYRNVGQNPCQYCGRDTHEIDWERSRKEREAHREKYGILYNKTEWWSI